MGQVIFGQPDNGIIQMSYVVKDIHAALDHWVNVMGVGPWFLFEKIQLDFFQYRGEDSPLEMSVAMANSVSGSGFLIGSARLIPAMVEMVGMAATGDAGDGSATVAMAVIKVKEEIVVMEVMAMM